MAAEVEFRTAGAADAAAVAELHCDSWQRHYRGAYSDSFLDDEAPAYLDQLWSRRLTDREGTRTALAEYDGQLIGIAHVITGTDERYGALLDNLHVRYGVKRSGIGTRLLALTADAVQELSPGSGLYLFVLEQNTAAQAFYEARGGIWADQQEVPPPGGRPQRLNGKPRCFRYVWSNPRP